MQHTKTNCCAWDLFHSDGGLQCGNCLAVDETKKDHLPIHYSLKELRALKTLRQSHDADLKMESGSTRIWLSRLTKADGQPYDNMVEVERNDAGTWKIVERYRAK